MMFSINFYKTEKKTFTDIPYINGKTYMLKVSTPLMTYKILYLTVWITW